MCDGWVPTCSTALLCGFVTVVWQQMIGPCAWGVDFRGVGVQFWLGLVSVHILLARVVRSLGGCERESVASFCQCVCGENSSCLALAGAA
eukprot:5099111-Amphidinium_carterae.1